MNDRLGYLKNKTNKLPLQSGVYIMKDKKGNIIYIGKAKLLKNRVTSYFTSIEKHTPKVYSMVENVYDFDYIVTTSEFEALILECSMIKQHEPKYNILLKDGKGYHYIKIYPKEWARITAVKQKLDDEAEYIGPYISSFVVKQAVDEANKAFMLPTCKKKFPQDFGKQRPCLNYHIKNCIAPCMGKISVQEYQNIIDDAVKFIKYGEANSIKLLKEKMQNASDNLEFEKAGRYRDRIRAINKIAEQQRVVYDNVPDIDVIAFAQSMDNCCAVVLKFRNGRLTDKIHHFLGAVDNISQTRSQFVVQFYTDNLDIPKSIFIDEEIEDMELIENYISQFLKRNVNISVPQKGDKLRLIEMAHANCSQHLAEKSGRTAKEVSGLDSLGKVLGFKNPPQYIEAYDISNIGIQTIVAGMVVFQGGRPLKGGYRKFSVTSVMDKPDDYSSMREVITRRLNRYIEHKDEGVGFGKLPDLILLDGGKGHVGVIEPIIKEFGLDIKVFGMVKDNKHRTRAIATNGDEISLTQNREAFAFLTQIQDEVHRFSIGYSRKKHAKSSMEVVLSKVEGIGKKRITELYKHFGSIENMEKATIEELSNVKSMNEKCSKNLHNFFKSDNIYD